MHPTIPNYSQFDYVVALSLIDGKQVFSDASSELPFGFLQVKCLNDNGWVVSKDSSKWIELKQKNTGKQIVQTEITQAENTIYYDSKINTLDYLAFENISHIKFKDELEFLENYKKEIGLLLDTLSLIEVTDRTIKMREKHRQALTDSDIIYINPLLFLPFKTNPFKQKDRVAYIDFPYALEYKFVTNIRILDGYNFEVPSNLNTVMIDNDIMLKYSSSYLPDMRMLSIVVDFKVKQTEFAPDNYEILKNFLEIIINKLIEPVILKKA